MKPNRGSVLGLMGLILFAAVTLAALRSASSVWVGIMANSSMVILFAATLQSRFAKTRRSRDWCFGFACFGWGYLILMGSPLGGDLFVDQLTTPVFKAVYLAFAPAADKVPYSEAAQQANYQYSVQSIKIFRAAASLVVGYIGAGFVSLLAWWDKGEGSGTGSTPGAGSD